MKSSLALANVPPHLLDDEDFQSINLLYLDLQGTKLFRNKHAEWQTGKRAVSGDSRAKHKLIIRNLRFAASTARRYKHRPLPVEDLHAVANKGLLHAAERFDPNKNTKFISYAVYWIRQQINAELASQAFVVRLPLNVYQSIYRSNAQTFQTQAHAHSGTSSLNPSELSNIDDATPKTVKDVLRATAPPIRLNTLPDQTHQLDPFHLPTKLRTEEHSDHCLTKITDMTLHDLIDTILSDRENTILRLYYGLGDEPRTLEEIGDVFDLTRERIRQLRNRALQKIFDHPTGKALGKDYCGDTSNPTAIVD